MANKTDLCATEPTQVPQIQFGEAVYVLPEGTSQPDATAREEGTSTSATTSSNVNDSATSKPSSGDKDKPTRKLLPRAISTLEGALFAKQHNLLYVETSAKEGWGVVDAFEQTARQILERVEKGEFERKKTSGVNLATAKTKGGCC